MIYRLTKEGKDFAKNISPDGRDEILDFLRDSKTAGLETLLVATGIERYTLLARLRKLRNKGLIREEEG